MKKLTDFDIIGIGQIIGAREQIRRVNDLDSLPVGIRRENPSMPLYEFDGIYYSTYIQAVKKVISKFFLPS